MTEAAQTIQAALSVKDAQELLALQAGLLQPAAEKAAAYGRLRVRNRRLDRRRSRRASPKRQAAEAQAKFMAVVDNAVKNAPAGTENAVALVKSAVAAANNAFESVQKAGKQAAEVADANFQAMSSTAVRADQGEEGLSQRRRTSVAAAALSEARSDPGFFFARERRLASGR